MKITEIIQPSKENELVTHEVQNGFYLHLEATTNRDRFFKKNTRRTFDAKTSVAI